MTNPQPELLARWLQLRLDQGAHGEAPPEGLDPDVIEAIDALRPDLAPAPDLDFDALLDALTEGPLARGFSPEEQAAALDFARSLDAADPADPDAYGVRAALAPDSLPAPALDLDALLDGLTEGPFARSAHPAPPPAEEAPANNVLAFPTATPATADLDRSRRRPRWVLPALSGLAMAATVLLFLLPATDQILKQGSPFDEAPQVASSDAAAPAPVVEGEPALEEAEDPGGRPTRSQQGAGGFRGSPAGPPADVRVEPTGGATPLAEAPEMEQSLPDAPAKEAKQKDAAFGDLGASAGEADAQSARAEDAPVLAGALGKQSPPAEEQAKRNLEGFGYIDGISTEGAASPGQGRSTGSASGGLVAGNRSETSVAQSRPTEPLAAEAANRGAETRSRPARPASAAPAVAAPPPPPAPARKGAAAADLPKAAPAADADRYALDAETEEAGFDDAAGADRGDATVDERADTRASAAARDVRQERREDNRSKKSDAAAAPASSRAPSADPSPTLPQGSSAAPGDGLIALKAAAWQVGSLPAPASGDAATSAQLTAYVEARARRDGATQDRLLPALLRAPEVDVVQYAAFELARRQAAAGLSDLALATLSAGLGRAGGDARRRSLLYAQQGEILEMRGDLAGAATSYKRAANLR